MYSTLKWSDNFRVVTKAGDFPRLLDPQLLLSLNWTKKKSNKKYFIKKEISIGKSKLSNIITAHLWNTQNYPSIQTKYKFHLQQTRAKTKKCQKKTSDLDLVLDTCAKTLSVSTVVSALCWTCWKSNKGIWTRHSLLATHPVDQIQGMLISMYAFQGQLNNYKINRLSLIVQVNIVLNVVDSDWRFDDLGGSHLQSQSELYHISWWYYTLVIDLIGPLHRGVIGQLSVRQWCYWLRVIMQLVLMTQHSSCT